MTHPDRDWHMHMVPDMPDGGTKGMTEKQWQELFAQIDNGNISYDMPDEFDERLHEHDEPDEGDGAGAIKWAFWLGVFYIAVLGVLKFTGVI